MDLANLATQTVLDIGLSVVTGGSMAIPAAIRSFGSSATEAAAEGADLNQQMLYATTSAAATYGIEQLCNVAYAGLKGIAPGIADGFVTDVVENLALKAVGDPAGAQALTNIGMLIASGAGEGVEETLESILNPFLQQLTYDKNAKTILQDPSLLADAAYEGLIGTVLGLFSRGTNTAIDLVANMIYDGTMPGEKLMEAAGVGESEVLGAMAIHQMGKMEDVAGEQLEDTLHHGQSTLRDWQNNLPALSAQAPIEIPENAQIKEQTKVGYEQVSFKWNSNGQNYEVRWHTKTPGAPEGQGNTWVVARTTPGTPTGQPRVEHILVGDEWVPRYQWQDAIRAYGNGTATEEQLKMLSDGHWQAP